MYINFPGKKGHRKKKKHIFKLQELQNKHE